MSAPLSFALNLTGNFATQLAPVNAGLAATEKGTHKAAEGVSFFEAELGKLSGTAGGVGFNLTALMKGGSLFTFDLAEGLETALELAHKLVETIADIGKEIVIAAGGAQDLALAERLNLGTEGAAGARELGESFSRTTRMDDDAVRKALLPLEEQGITNTKLLDDLATAASDIAIRRNDPGSFEGALSALRKVALKGEVDARALRELAVGEADFYADLGDLLGMTAKGAEKATKAGKVSSETLLSVLLNQVAQRQGGALGIASTEGANTLGATLQRLRDLPENVLKSAADSPGLKSVKGVLDSFIAFAKGPAGTGLIDKIATGMGKVAQSALAFISTDEGQKKIVDTIGRIGEGVFALLDGFSRAVPFLVKFADVTTTIGEGWFAVTSAVTGTIYEFDKLFVSIWSFITDLPGKIARGFMDGIDAMVWGVGELGNAAVNKLRDVLGIHSPSTVFREMGAYSAEGFALGLEGGADRIGRARALIGAGDEGGAAVGGGAGGFVWTGNVIVQAAGGDAHAIGDAAGSAVRQEFRLILDELYHRRGGRS